MQTTHAQALEVHHEPRRVHDALEPLLGAQLVLLVVVAIVLKFCRRGGGRCSGKGGERGLATMGVTSHLSCLRIPSSMT
jgi:hypothetical protein